MKTLKQYFCKHSGSWTYDKYNSKLRVCLKCGYIANGWIKKKGSWIEKWEIPGK